MKKIKQKIIFGAVLFGCSVIGLSAAARITHKAKTDALPVSLSDLSNETPVIILDAGHGGIDGGCSTSDGVPEKGINLDIMLKLRDMLEISGFTVKVTRDEDISIHDKGIEGIAAQKNSDMDNRLAIFNSEENALCISIHQNQFTKPQYSGAQMFYSGTNDNSEALARSIRQRFRELLQPDNEREIKQCGKELFLCYFSENPTVMVECGFLSNPEEAALLVTDEYRSKVAFTIYSGIFDYLSSKK